MSQILINFVEKDVMDVIYLHWRASGEITPLTKEEDKAYDIYDTIVVNEEYLARLENEASKHPNSFNQKLALLAELEDIMCELGFIVFKKFYGD